MATTTKSHTVVGGSLGPYDYPFDHIDDGDISVTVNSVLQTVTTDYTLDSAQKRITFQSGKVTTGDVVQIYRDTTEDPITATFVSGSTIRSNELNDNFKQLLYIAQETDDQTMSSLNATTKGPFTIGQSQVINFEGSADDAHETTLTVTNPTADRTITLPNETGTVVTTGSSGVVTSTMITDGTIVNADINSSAAIAQSKLNIANATTSAAGYQSAADKTKLDGIETAATADQTAAEIRTLVESASDSNVFTDADHTKLNAIEASATADQTAAEIRTLVESATDSNVFTDADHTKLNAIEANATADQTASEIKTLLASDNLDASHLAANSVGTSEIADAELVTLAGMPGATASILADSTALTSTTAELNLLDGKSFSTSVSGSSTDVQIPSAKAVNDQILAVTNALGGFVAIADELNFPNANPDPSNGAGTVVSIGDAGGVVVNGSGVATIANGTVGNSTVTVNGFPSSLYSKTLAAGVGLQVQTTSTLNTYTYHKLLAKEADVEQLSGDINDFNERYRIASSAPSSDNDEGDLWFDTAANKMKVYDGSAWGDVASTGSFYIVTLSAYSGTGGNSASFNGSAYRFTLSNTPTSAEQLIVSINGVVQKPNAGSSQPSEGFAISGSSIIFSNAPATGSDSFIVLIGSSVSIGTPSANTVTEAILQNNVVSEAKLKVSNSPTNGQFLSAQSGNSGGLTWASVTSTPEGTAILSTGESGASKYLREDGDGTCSWQTVVGAVADGCIFENDQTISNNYTIASGKGAHSVGPITVNATVTVNGNWVVS